MAVVAQSVLNYSPNLFNIVIHTHTHTSSVAVVARSVLSASGKVADDLGIYRQWRTRVVCLHGVRPGILRSQPDIDECLVEQLEQ